MTLLEYACYASAFIIVGIAYLITKAAERSNKRFDYEHRMYWAAVFDGRDAYAKKQAEEAKDFGKDW